MPDKIQKIWSRDGNNDIDVRYPENGDGTNSLGVILKGSTSAVSLYPDLKLGAKSLALTMSTGTGSVPIPDMATVVGVCPVSSTAIRIGLEVPEVNGTKTGSAVSGDLKKGIPVLPAVYTWFNIGPGVSRSLYVLGGASDVVEIVVS